MRPNLIVVRSENVESLADFYSILGCDFKKHRHGHGSEHYAYKTDDGFVFEIYPRVKGSPSTVGVRLGFQVDSVDDAIHRVPEHGKSEIISKPADSPWGRRTVLIDPEGHRVELVQSMEPIKEGSR